MTIIMSPQQRKAIRKVTDLLQDNPLGLSFGEIMEKLTISKASLTKTLEAINATQENGLWCLPAEKSASVPSATNPTVADSEAHALTNPNTGNIELPETGSVIKKQILEQIAQEEENAENLQETVENSPAKTYILIETCHLSLATDTTGEQPVLAKYSWFGEEGEEMDEDDSKILDRVTDQWTNTIRFAGVDYNRLNWLGKTQILHGIFHVKEHAIDRMQELCEGKFPNNLEVIEV